MVNKGNWLDMSVSVSYVLSKYLDRYVDMPTITHYSAQEQSGLKIIRLYNYNNIV